MSERVEIGGLGVARCLHDLIRDEIAPGTGVAPEAFWRSLADIVRDLGPKNRALLDHRDQLQARIDAWHAERAAQPVDPDEYRAFLESIGYLVPAGEDFRDRNPEHGRRDRADRRPPARGPGRQRPLRTQRRQRPLGQPLRRALRHRRHRARRRWPGDRRIRPRTREARHRVDERLPRRDGSARGRLARGSHRLRPSKTRRRRRRRTRGDARRRLPNRTRRPRPARRVSKAFRGTLPGAFRGTPPGARPASAPESFPASFCETTGCTSSCTSTRITRSGR